MSRIPSFIEALDKMREIHIKKNEDYASADNPLSNFEFSAQFSEKFPSWSKPYAVLIGTKFARLQTLLPGKSPNNESIEDTFIDIANYVLLWRAAYLKRKGESK